MAARANSTYRFARRNAGKVLFRTNTEGKTIGELTARSRYAPVPYNTRLAYKPKKARPAGFRNYGLAAFV